MYTYVHRFRAVSAIEYAERLAFDEMVFVHHKGDITMNEEQEF